MGPEPDSKIDFEQIWRITGIIYHIYSERLAEGE